MKRSRSLNMTLLLFGFSLIPLGCTRYCPAGKKSRITEWTTGPVLRSTAVLTEANPILCYYGPDEDWAEPGAEPFNFAGNRVRLFVSCGATNTNLRITEVDGGLYGKTSNTNWDTGLVKPSSGLCAERIGPGPAEISVTLEVYLPVSSCALPGPAPMQTISGGAPSPTCEPEGAITPGPIFSNEYCGHGPLQGSETVTSSCVAVGQTCSGSCPISSCQTFACAGPDQNWCRDERFPLPCHCICD